MINILDLKQYQEIKIRGRIYLVLNKIKYVEKSSYWFEYRLENKDNKEICHLNVELSKKAILYFKVKENIEADSTNITFNGKPFSLFETGTGKAEICYGICDIGMHEEIKYYEYICDNNRREIISIERWRAHQEISIGQTLELSDIIQVN
jgi:hypothetical protein